MKGWRMNPDGTKFFVNTKAARISKEKRARLQTAFNRAADPEFMRRFKKSK